METRWLLSAAAAYALTDLGTIAGYRDFTATALNESGQVVGYAGRTDPYYSVDGARAFVYRGGRMQTVGGRKSIATGINDKGQAWARSPPAAGCTRS